MNVDVNPKFSEKYNNDSSYKLKINHAVTHLYKTIELTQGILWEVFSEYSDYGMAGSCFPIIINSKVYIAMAKHTLSNNKYRPEQSLYVANRSSKTAFKYNKIIYGNCELAARNDYCFMEIADPEIWADPNRSYVMSLQHDTIICDTDNIIDIYLRGYPEKLDGNEVPFAGTTKISTRAFFTNGFIKISDSKEDGCKLVKMKTPTMAEFDFDPNGMSGSAIYGITKEGKAGFIGIVIGFNEYTEEYQFITGQSLIDSLKSII